MTKLNERNMNILNKGEIHLHIRSLTIGYDEYKHIWTKYNEHGLIIIDQTVNINYQRRNLSLQIGIWKFNTRKITLPHMKYNEISVELNGKTYISSLPKPCILYINDEIKWAKYEHIWPKTKYIYILGH